MAQRAANTMDSLNNPAAAPGKCMPKIILQIPASAMPMLQMPQAGSGYAQAGQSPSACTGGTQYVLPMNCYPMVQPMSNYGLPCNMPYCPMPLSQQSPFNVQYVCDNDTANQQSEGVNCDCNQYGIGGVRTMSYQVQYVFNGEADTDVNMPSIGNASAGIDAACCCRNTQSSDAVSSCRRSRGKYSRTEIAACGAPKKENRCTDKKCSSCQCKKNQERDNLDGEADRITWAKLQSTDNSRFVSRNDFINDSRFNVPSNFQAASLLGSRFDTIDPSNVRLINNEGVPHTVVLSMPAMVSPQTIPLETTQLRQPVSLSSTEKAVQTDGFISAKSEINSKPHHTISTKMGRSLSTHGTQTDLPYGLIKKSVTTMTIDDGLKLQRKSDSTLKATSKRLTPTPGLKILVKGIPMPSAASTISADADQPKAETPGAPKEQRKSAISSNYDCGGSNLNDLYSSDQLSDSEKNYQTPRSQANSTISFAGRSKSERNMKSRSLTKSQSELNGSCQRKTCAEINVRNKEDFKSYCRCPTCNSMCLSSVSHCCKQLCSIPNIVSNKTCCSNRINCCSFRKCRPRCK